MSICSRKLEVGSGGHPLSSPNLYLFGEEQGRELVVNGLKSGESGLVVRCRWSGDDW